MHSPDATGRHLPRNKRVTQQQPRAGNAATTQSRARRVLVVDDDAEARLLAVEELADFGFTVAQASDGESAERQIRTRRPDLVILDLGLPGIDGLDVLKSVRAAGNLPVIVLTGRRDASDRVVGLELGADDYVLKPFDPRELVARVNAVLRRSTSHPTSTTLDFGDLVIDLISRDVHCRGELLSLTAKEFDLLACMAGSPRRVFTREQLLDDVWNSSTEWQDPTTVNEHIHRLRRKLEVDPGTPRWIITMRGAGYRFTPSGSITPF
jgi:two-component system phosphate regulon response regulator PhoB